MIEIEGMPQLIEARQAYLRSLAAHSPVAVPHGPVRQRAGRLLVRFGRWIEGCRPEVTLDSPVAGSYRSA